MTKCLAMARPLTLVIGMLAGCQSDQTPMPVVSVETAAGYPLERTTASAPKPVVADRGASTQASEQQIAQPWRFADISQVRRAASWDARLAQLHQADQEWLRERNEHYAGALAFGSPEEQQRMIAQGFPMPEEWLAARLMPDTELEALAKAGNRKAQMFFIDRVSDEIGPILESGRGLKASSPQDKALFSKVVDASSMAYLLLKSTKSPFAAYLEGRILTSMTQYNPPESMAVAIMLAGDLGDPRANDLRARYFRAHPNMDAGEITSSYQGRKDLILGEKPSRPR